MGRTVADTSETTARRNGTASDGRIPRVSWTEFEGRLAMMLASLHDDEFLILEAEGKRAHPGAYVQFAGGGPGGLLAEAVSDDFLVTLPLSDTQRADLAGFGWTAPSGDPEAPANYRRTWDAPVPVEEVARLAVRTLRKVYGVRSPGDLVYHAFTATKSDAPGTALTKVPELTEEELQALVARTLALLFDVEDVRPDGAGFWAIWVGESTLSLSRVGADESLLRVAVAVRQDEAPSPRLFAALNDANAKLLAARAVRVDGIVYCAAEVPLAGLTLDLLARTVVGVTVGS
ncbi:MAG: hypothetical protein RL338_1767, partial [Chloroflexota bacterium]